MTRLLYDRIITKYELGDFSSGKVYLDQLAGIVKPLPREPRFEWAISALMIPYVARITGAVDRFETAQSAADSILSTPTVLHAFELAARNGLALAAVMKGDDSSAREQYQWLATQSRGMAGISSDRVLGLLSQTMGELDQASHHFEDGLVYCRDSGYRPELAWVCHDYAEMLLERNTAGGLAKPVDLLNESASISSELGMRPLSARSAALQEKAESVAARVPAFPDGLTQREVDAIRLVASGRTDREIAGELVIEVRTVTTHVGNILNKTVAANRAEAASYANQRGLVIPDSDVSC